MDIKIAKKGNAKGTIGWLAKGLENGSLKIEEGAMQRNGNHGLWLKGTDGLSQFLAAYNQYALSPTEYERANTYELAEMEDNTIGCTEACWESLRKIATAWCEECNAALEQERPIDVKIIRVDKITEVAA